MELALEFVSVEICVLVYLPFQNPACRVQRYECFDLLLAEVVQDFVCGDPVQPCVEPGFLTECRQSGPDLDEYVLKEVVGVVMRTEETADMPVEPFGVCIHDAIESLLLPAAAVQFYDLVVRHVK